MDSVWKSAAVDQDILILAVMAHNIADISCLESHLFFRCTDGGKEVTDPLGSYNINFYQKTRAYKKQSGS